jgi:hypothetical protein
MPSRCNDRSYESEINWGIVLVIEALSVRKTSSTYTCGEKREE